MIDLVEFLLALLDVDKAEIERHPDDAFEVDGYDATKETGYPCLEILTIGKQRALREVEAVRRIIDLHGHGPHECVTWDEALGETCTIYDVECPTLRLLAQPYVGHSAFREEWRP